MDSERLSGVSPRGSFRAEVRRPPRPAPRSALKQRGQVRRSRAAEALPAPLGLREHLAGGIGVVVIGSGHFTVVPRPARRLRTARWSSWRGDHLSPSASQCRSSAARGPRGFGIAQAPAHLVGVRTAPAITHRTDLPESSAWRRRRRKCPPPSVPPAVRQPRPVVPLGPRCPSGETMRHRRICSAR